MSSVRTEMAKSGSKTRRVLQSVLILATLLLGGLVLAQPTSAPRLSPEARIDRLIANKTEHTLEAYFEGELVQRYTIAIGQGGMGPKRWEGDRTTPEGEYTIDARHRSADFRRFLHVSYPNEQDRERYRELQRQGEVPDGAGIGSAIGIHGPPQRLPAFLRLRLGIDWTAGCMTVTDQEIDDLYRAVLPNARLTITQ